MGSYIYPKKVGGVTWREREREGERERICLLI